MFQGARWFGGVVTDSQRWPLNAHELDMKPYIVGEYGNMVERFWLSSKGVGIYIHDDVPLHLSWNHKQNGGMCVKANYEGDMYSTRNNKLPVLKYTICEDFDLVRVHRLMFRSLFSLPDSFPALIKLPIWYTGFNNSMTNTDISQYVKDSRKHGFPSGYIDIGSVTLNTGDFSINPERKTLIATLHKLGVKVFGTTGNFVKLQSKEFTEGLQKDVFIKASSGQVPALVKSGSEIGAVIDPTNPDAHDWFVVKLQELQRNTGR